MSSEIRRLSERTFTPFNDRSVSYVCSRHIIDRPCWKGGWTVLQWLHCYINKDISLYYDAAAEENSRKNYFKFQLLAWNRMVTFRLENSFKVFETFSTSRYFWWDANLIKKEWTKTTKSSSIDHIFSRGLSSVSYQGKTTDQVKECREGLL